MKQITLTDFAEAARPGPIWERLLRMTLASLVPTALWLWLDAPIWAAVMFWLLSAWWLRAATVIVNVANIASDANFEEQLDEPHKRPEGAEPCPGCSGHGYTL